VASGGSFRHDHRPGIRTDRYEVLRAHFGQSGGGGFVQGGAVPEPSAASLTLFLLLPAFSGRGAAARN
jgi:hypothetical protein